MTNKGALRTSDIILSEGNKIVTVESEIVNIFNEYYINIVKSSSGKTPTNIADDLPPGTSFINIIEKIVEAYKDHPSILEIKQNKIHTETFSFKEVSEDEIYKLLKLIDPTKSIGEDTIPPKILKIAAAILAKPLTNLINVSIKQNVFPTKAKRAAVLPFFKSDDRTQKKNYRPVSVLNTLSKIFETVIKNQLVPFFDKCLLDLVSAYRKHYGTQHVLLRLIEEWKKGLDSGLLVGAILMDLSKAFDCIPHDLLIAKLEAYGFQNSALLYIYSYLKGRKQSVRINNTYSSFLTILSGIPQGSILGPILFNIFINDLFMFIRDAHLHGFANDHTLSAAKKNLEDLKIILNKESEKAIEWLNKNEMIVNPSKFQAIVLAKTRETISTKFHINDKEIESKDSIKLLGITIDDKLNFDSHISKLCNRASGQLNTLFRFNNYLTPQTKS